MLRNAASLFNETFLHDDILHDVDVIFDSQMDQVDLKPNDGTNEEETEEDMDYQYIRNYYMIPQTNSSKEIFYVNNTKVKDNLMENNSSKIETKLKNLILLPTTTNTIRLHKLLTNSSIDNSERLKNDYNFQYVSTINSKKYTTSRMRVPNRNTILKTTEPITSNIPLISTTIITTIPTPTSTKYFYSKNKPSKEINESLSEQIKKKIRTLIENVGNIAIDDVKSSPTIKHTMNDKTFASILHVPNKLKNSEHDYQVIETTPKFFTSPPTSRLPVYTLTAILGAIYGVAFVLAMAWVIWLWMRRKHADRDRCLSLPTFKTSHNNDY
ncbi:hypothetical protein SNEBB_010273 [Seison nebaliae]|nr:hypothetical protein SNEBB_010273 [Seison nebaliae]